MCSTSAMFATWPSSPIPPQLIPGSPQRIERGSCNGIGSIFSRKSLRRQDLRVVSLRHPAPAAAVKMGHDTWSLEFTKLKVVLSFFIEIGTDMIHSFI
jgi:hypothetical protein